MNDLKKEVDCGLEGKYNQLVSHIKELEFYKMYEKHLVDEIDLIRYKLSLFKSEFFEKLLAIRAADLEKNKLNIKSEEILIDYFEKDIEIYFKSKVAKKLDELRKV